MTVEIFAPVFASFMCTECRCGSKGPSDGRFNGLERRFPQPQ
jgi:hypothetical protein